MGIEVNGHQLPPLLVKLIEDGKWGNGQTLPHEALTKLLKNNGLPAFEKTAMYADDVKTMEENTLQNFFSDIINPGERLELSKFYSQASSKELGFEIEDKGILDLDNAVFIAGNTDGEVICLDYRQNPDNPCLRAWFDSDGINDWRMIAPDFETFARGLGLVE